MILLTCTGDRPKSFRLLEYFISKQTTKDFTWVVIDDGLEPTVCTQNQRVIRRVNLTEGIHTLMPQLFHARTLIKDEDILFIEDDDWYSPYYVETMGDILKNFDMVGLTKAKYYSISKPGYKFFDNTKHASLAATGISKQIWNNIYPFLEGDCYLDIRLWNQRPNGCNIHKFLFDCSETLHVGIKNAPGRKGLTSPQLKDIYKRDRNYTVLKEWIGNNDATLMIKELT